MCFLPVALSSYNIFPYAEIIRLPLPARRELREYQNAGRSSFPGSRHLRRWQAAVGRNYPRPPGGRQS